jgi:hypothetical protein
MPDQHLPPNQFVVENQEQTTETIHDVATGASTVLPVKRDVVILNVATGERSFESTTSRWRTIDGRTVPAAELFYCRNCGRGPYSSAGIAYCTVCQAVLGKHCCAKTTAPLCRACSPTWWQRFIAWFKPRPNGGFL